MRLLKVIPLVAVLLQSPVELASAQEDSTVWIRQSEVFADPADENATNDEPLRMRLEIASQRFDATIPGSGPVTLVGVTHIGDAGYYDALGELLAGFDVVLYESVAPDGARGVSGVDHPGRTSETLAAMEFVGFAIEWHRMDRGSLPAGLPELIENAGAMDTRFPGWLQAASVDAWDTPLRLEIHEVQLPKDDVDALPPTRTEWRLISTGADQAVGGDGTDTDIVLESVNLEVPPRSKGGIQAQIASALGLAFQINALDYRGPRWILADMTEAELRASAEELGVDVSGLLDGLGGGGVSARLGRMVLMLMRLADFFSGNQVRDIVKVVLVEALSDPASLEMAQAGMPGMDGLMELILHERNRVALEILDEELVSDPKRTFALFYGAAHMPGLAEGLLERGYQPAGEPVWLAAIDIDLEASQVDPATMEMIRGQFDAALGRKPSRRSPSSDGEQE
ncbi:MAG: hypothetical protein P8J45_05105 [Phycisphaerales bacterium]|nr:hypothetical protein [Phycisphaerales bacterium]